MLHDYARFVHDYVKDGGEARFGRRLGDGARRRPGRLARCLVPALAAVALTGWAGGVAAQSQIDIDPTSFDDEVDGFDTYTITNNSADTVKVTGVTSNLYVVSFAEMNDDEWKCLDFDDNFEECKEIRVTIPPGESYDVDIDFWEEGTATISHSAPGHTGISSIYVTVAGVAGVWHSTYTLEVEPGATVTYDIGLDSEPTDDVIIKMTSSSTDITVSPDSIVLDADNYDSGVEIAVAADSTAEGDFTISHTVTSDDSDYSGMEVYDVTVRVASSAGVWLDPGNLDIAPGASANYSIGLDSEPTDTVIVKMTPSAAAITVDPDSVMLHADNYSGGVAVTVMAGATAVGTYTISHAASSDDTDYDGITVGNVTVAVASNPAVHVSATTLILPYRVGKDYTIVLRSQPTDTVTVWSVSSDTSVARLYVDGHSDFADSVSTTFTVSDWSTPKEVFVRGYTDDPDSDDEATSIKHRATSTDTNYNGIAIDSIAVVVTDPDQPGFRMFPDTMRITEGAAAEPLEVTLASLPSAAVSVTLTSNAPDVTVSSDDSTFFASETVPVAHDSTTFVYVRAADDADAVDLAAMLTLVATSQDAGYNGLTATVPVLVRDDERSLVFSPTAVRMGEDGDTAQYTIVLQVAPSGEVKVALESADTNRVTVSPDTVTFTTTDWNVAQAVTVTGVDNDSITGDRSAYISHLASGGGYEGASGRVTVAVEEDDAGFVLSKNSVSMGEDGDSAKYTIRLLAAPLATVQVVLRDFDTNAVTVAPANLEFTTTDWNVDQTVKVTGVHDNDAGDRKTYIAHRAGGGGYSRAYDEVAVTVEDDDAAIDLSLSSVDVDENGDTTYTVRLAAKPVAAVQVTLNSTDPSAASVSPGGMTFTTTDWNQAQTATVSGGDDFAAVDRMASLIHTGAGGGYDGIADTLAVTVINDDHGGLVLSRSSVSVGEDGDTVRYMVGLAREPGDTITVALASTDETVATVAPDTLTFTTTDWREKQTVAVVGVNDGATGDRTAAITHTASGVGYDGIADTVAVTVEDDDAEFDLSLTSATVDENGDTAKYTISLAAAPTGDVTVAVESSDASAATVDSASLTFTKSDWNVARTLTITGVNDDVPGDRAALITHAASGGGYEGVGAGVTVRIYDDDAGLELSAYDLRVDEDGDTARYTVSLASEPAGEVTVSLASSNEAVATVDSASLTFTTTDWNMARTVTVTGVDDNDVTGSRVANIRHTVTGGGYGSVAATVRVTVEDDDAELELSVSAVSVGEDGGTEQYTVSLAAEPLAEVTVTVASTDTTAATVDSASLTFTTSDWNVARTLTVTGVNDNIVTGDRTAAVTHTASGGGYGGLADTVAVTVKDDDGGFELSESSVTVGEDGGTATYTVKLSAAPSGDVTVTVASTDETAATVDSATLTFGTTDWNQAKTVTVTGVNDNGVGDRTATVTHTASGGGYDGVADTVAVTVEDDDGGFDLSVTSVSVGEAGDTAKYTVRLGAEPTGEVTVTVASSDTNVATVDSATLTFGTTDWNQAKTVTVTGVDDSGVGDRTAAVTHTASGGGYDGLADTVAVTVKDDDGGFGLSESSVTVGEAGGTATYTVELSAAPSGEVTVTVASTDETAATVDSATLTFTETTWNVAKTVKVTGVDDSGVGDRTAAITHVASGGGYDGLADTVAVTVKDDDGGFGLSESSVTVGEDGGTATYTVELSAAPSGEVTVTVASTDETAATVDSATLTFTETTWNVAKTVTVTGVDDSGVGDRTAAVTHTASGGGYGGLADTVAVTVKDDDGGFGLSESSVTVGEDGGTATYTVELSAAPSGEVTVTVASTDETAATVDSATLTFTETTWNVAKTVTVTGVDDSGVGDRTAAVTHTASGGGYDGLADTVAVTVKDDDGGFGLSESSVTVGEDGGTATYTVELSAAPSGEVTVTVASTDTTAATVDSATLTFTETTWNVAKTVTVTGVDDSGVGDRTASVTHTASGGGYGGLADTVAVTVKDDDGGFGLSESSVTVGEDGGTATYTVELSAAPSGEVTVTVASTDETAATVDSATLTFTETTWNVAKTVTVTGVDDSGVGDRTAAVTHTASGGGYDGLADTVAVTVKDDDGGFELSESSVTVGEDGGTATYTVELSAAPSGEVTVTVASTDETAATVDSATLTFTETTWNVAKTVTVTGVDDSGVGDRTAAVTHTASGGGYDGLADTVAVTVKDDDGGFELSESSVTVGEDGGTATYTVELSAAPSGEVTVTVASTDTTAATVDSATLTFTETTWNVAKTVTVTGVDDSGVGDRTASVTHVASGGGYDGLADTVAVTVKDDDGGFGLSESSVTVGEDGGTATYTVELSAAPSGEVTVTVASTDTTAATVDSATLTFTETTWNVAKTVTVTGVDDSGVGDRTAAVTHTASGGGYDGLADTVAVTVKDDDGGFGLSESSVTVGEAGGTATYTVELSAAPSGEVTVTVASTDETAATVDSATLTFTETTWNVAKTVKVTGVDDSGVGDRTAAITHVASGGGYDGLADTVAVTVKDDDGGFGLSESSVTVGEDGGTATYTVELSAAPSGEVTVTVASTDETAATVDSATLTFTETTWNVAKTVTVTGVDDSGVGDRTAAVTHTASGGGYGGLADTVAVTVKDDDGGFGLSESSVTVGEDGGTATYTVELSAAPSGEVTVTVASTDETAATVDSATLTFTETTWNVAKTVTVTGVDDSGVGDRTAAVTHTASGGGYDGLADTVAVTVKDDDGGFGLSESSVTVGEDGGTATYTVELSAAPSGEVTVTVASTDTTAATVDSATLTFTETTWNVAKTVTVTGVDDSGVGDRTAAITHVASGGGYDGLADTVAVTVKDDDGGFGLSESSVTVGEDGGTATYTVELSAAPSGEVTVTVASTDETAATVDSATLTFTETTWNVAKTVTVTGVNDNGVGDRTAAVTHTASGGGYDGVADTVAVTVKDDDGGFGLSESSVTVGEDGGTATYTVELSAAPSGEVTVALASTDTTAATVDSATLTFTETTWNVAKTVTVTGANDSGVGDRTTAITHVASGGGYDGLADTVEVTVEDDDAELDLSVTLVSMGEAGDSAQYTVALSAEPTGEVTVTLASADTNVATVDSDTLTFGTSDWNVAKTVKVTGVNDDLGGDRTTEITHTANGGGYVNVQGSVRVTAEDDDAELDLSVTLVSMGEAGDSAKYTVQLGAEPTGEVTVTLASADTNVATVDSDTLTFGTSDWNVAKTVKVTGVNDDLAGNRTTEITHTANGGGYVNVQGSVRVTAEDDDAELDLSVTLVSMGEAGDSAKYTVQLGAEPTGEVTVTLASADTNVATVDSDTLTFGTSDWNVAKTVKVTGVNDDLAGNRTTEITHTANGGGYVNVQGSVRVTAEDDDAELDLSVTLVSMGEAGDSAQYTVQLGAEPTGEVTVTLASADTNVATVDSDTLTFGTSDWNVAKTVKVTGVNDDLAGNRTTEITHTANGGGYVNVQGSVRATAEDDDAELDLSVTLVSMGEAGDSAQYTVQLGAEPTGEVTVTLASADTNVATVDSDTLTFGTSDWNVAKTVKVTGVNDDLAGNRTTEITHTANGGGYVNVQGSVRATAEDDDAELDLSVTLVSMGEAGDSAQYTVQLGAEPTGEVTVTLASADTNVATVDSDTLTFGTSDWNVAKTVKVTGVNDDLAGNRTTEITHTANGGGYVEIQGTVSATAIDDDAEFDLSTTTVSMGEAGDSAQYPVRLAAEPVGEVTVTLVSSNPDVATIAPATMRFTATDWNQVQTATVTGVNDDLAGDRPATITHTANGGGYVEIQGTVSATAIDDDAEFDLSTTTVSMGEAGDSAQYPVRLAAEPVGEVTVTLVSSNPDVATIAPATMRFTATDWNQVQTATVTGVNDDLAGDRPATITHTANGGGYVEIQGTVSATAIDDDAEFDLSTTTVSMGEAGDSAQYPVRLAAEPVGEVTVTLVSSNPDVATIAPATMRFTATDWNQVQTATVTGVNDDLAGDRPATITHTANGGGYVEIQGTVSATAIDDDAEFDLPVTSVAVEEDGGTAQYPVRLAAEPVGEVTVTLASSDAQAATVAPGSLTFTATDWNQTQTVTVTGVNDDLAGDRPAQITHTANGGGYVDIVGTVTVTSFDDDAGLDLPVTSVAIAENGDTAQYTVRLVAEPVGQVTLTLASSNPGVATVLPASLTFTPFDWNQVRTVTVTGVNDDEAGDRSAQVAHTASGGGYDGVTGTVTVAVVDDDGGFDFSVTSVSVGEAGDTDTYTVGLAAEPTADVTVALASTDTEVATVSPGSLTFTAANWNQPHTVTVTGVDDDQAGARSTEITHTATGGGYDGVTGTVAVAVEDDDGGFDLSVTSVSVGEAGDTETYTVSLAAAPTADVTVALASTDTAVATVSPAGLTFTATNWNQARTVSVTGVDDDVAGDRAATITHTAEGGGYNGSTGTVAVAVEDDDAEFDLSASSISVGEDGDTTQYTVRLSAVPTGPVTVALASTNPGVATVAPASLTFTAANWNQTRTVTVTGVNDDVSEDRAADITHTASGGGYDGVTGTVAVTVPDDDQAGLVVAPTSVAVSEAGGQATYTVRLGGAPTGDVTVTPTTSDATIATVSPASLTFTADDWDQERTVTVKA